MLDSERISDNVLPVPLPFYIQFVSIECMYCPLKSSPKGSVSMSWSSVERLLLFMPMSRSSLSFYFSFICVFLIVSLCTSMWTLAKSLLLLTCRASRACACHDDIVMTAMLVLNLTAPNNSGYICRRILFLLIVNLTWKEGLIRRRSDI